MQTKEIAHDDNLNADILDLMKGMLERDPKKRFDMIDVLGHRAIVKNRCSFKEPLSSEEFTILIRNFLINSPSGITSEAPEDVLKFLHQENSEEVWINLQDYFKNTGYILNKPIEFKESGFKPDTTVQNSETNNQADSKSNETNFRAHNTVFREFGSELNKQNSGVFSDQNKLKEREILGKRIIKIDNSYDFWEKIKPEDSKSEVGQFEENKAIANNKQLLDSKPSFTEMKQPVNNFEKVDNNYIFQNYKKNPELEVKNENIENKLGVKYVRRVYASESHRESFKVNKINSQIIPIFKFEKANESEKLKYGINQNNNSLKDEKVYSSISQHQKNELDTSIRYSIEFKHSQTVKNPQKEIKINPPIKKWENEEVKNGCNNVNINQKSNAFIKKQTPFNTESREIQTILTPFHMDKNEFQPFKKLEGEINKIVLNPKVFKINLSGNEEKHSNIFVKPSIEFDKINTGHIREETNYQESVINGPTLKNTIKQNLESKPNVKYFKIS